MKFIYNILIVISFNTIVFASNEEKEARLDALMGLEIEQLGEVEVKLDDVFDIFDGLVKPQNVKVASGIQQSTATAPASTTVITSQDIEATGARNLEEILEAVPGMHVSLSEYRFAPLYDVRGMHSSTNNEILMMVNGVPIKSIIAGSRGGAWSPPPVQSISRIEIIRGPGSALYGADAVSGVVNIITKIADDINGTEIGFRTGSFQTYNPWLLHGGEHKGFKTMLSLNYLDTDGHKETVYQDMQSLLDKASGTNVSKAPGRTYLQQQRLSIQANVSKENWQSNLYWIRGRNIGAGLSTTFVINPEENHEQDFIQADIAYNNSQIIKDWGINARLSYQGADDKSLNSYSARPGAIRNGELLPYGAPNNVGYYQRQTRLDLSSLYRGFDKHIIRLGIGASYAELYKTTWSYLLNKQSPVMVDVRALGMVSIPENARQNRYLFAQDTWHIDSNWELTTGIRHDWYSDFEGTTNPRAALVWQVMPSLTAKLLYGKAFRAPSFVEMYLPASNVVAAGNPHLKAEVSSTWEIGVDYRLNSDLNLALNVFDYTVTDKIQRTLTKLNNFSIYTYNNIGTLKGSGFELETRWKINNKSSLLFNYAYAKVKTENSNEAGNYPHHQAYVRHDLLLGNNWFFDTKINWVSNRDRPLGDDRPLLKDYVELDLTLRYKNMSKFNPWDIAIGVRNLLNEDRREPGDARLIGDYPKAGREIFGEIRYKF